MNVIRGKNADKDSVETPVPERKGAKYVPMHKRTRTQSAMPQTRNKSREADEIDE